MNKKKGTSKNGLFFLLGVLAYSLFFWATKSNTQVFGMIIIGLLCNVLYKMDYKMSSEKKWIETKDVIYMCVGAIFNSLIGGFPFNYFNRG